MPTASALATSLLLKHERFNTRTLFCLITNLEECTCSHVMWFRHGYAHVFLLFIDSRIDSSIGLPYFNVGIIINIMLFLCTNINKIQLKISAIQRSFHPADPGRCHKFLPMFPNYFNLFLNTGCSMLQNCLACSCQLRAVSRLLYDLRLLYVKENSSEWKLDKLSLSIPRTGASAVICINTKAGCMKIIM